MVMMECERLLVDCFVKHTRETLVLLHCVYCCASLVIFIVQRMLECFLRVLPLFRFDSTADRYGAVYRRGLWASSSASDS